MIKTVKPTTEETKSAVEKQKNRAPRPEGITAENLKADLDTSAQMLYEVYENT